MRMNADFPLEVEQFLELFPDLECAGIIRVNSIIAYVFENSQKHKTFYIFAENAGNLRGSDLNEIFAREKMMKDDLLIST